MIPKKILNLNEFALKINHFLIKIIRFNKNKDKSRLEVLWNSQTNFDQFCDWINKWVPLFIYSLFFSYVFSHTMSKGFKKSISEYDSCHFYWRKWTQFFVFIVINWVLKVGHDFDSWDWHFHGLVFWTEEIFELILIIFSIKWLSLLI